MAHQTAAQYRASMRNLRKARRARRSGHHRSNPYRRRRRHSNPEMPVVLVNPPRARGHRRRRRSNPRRRRRNPTVGHYVAANPVRRRRHRYVRHNPSHTFGQSFAAMGLGLLGGAVAGGLDWGVSYAPIKPVWNAVLFGGTGALLSLGVSWLLDPRVGAGIAGGTSASLFGRIRAMVAYAAMGAEGTSSGAGAVRRLPPRQRGAGAVVRGQAQAVPGLPTAQSMGTSYAGTTTRQPVARGAGLASYNVPGTTRHYGPDWVRLRGTSAVRYVSAHSS